MCNGIPRDDTPDSLIEIGLTDLPKIGGSWYALPAPLFKEKKAELNQLLSKLSDKFDKKLAETDLILIPDRKVLTFQFTLLKVRSSKYVVYYD